MHTDSGTQNKNDEKHDDVAAGGNHNFSRSAILACESESVQLNGAIASVAKDLYRNR
jgi:hypothetical protein